MEKWKKDGDSDDSRLKLGEKIGFPATKDGKLTMLVKSDRID